MKKLCILLALCLLLSGCAGAGSAPETTLPSAPTAEATQNETTIPVGTDPIVPPDTNPAATQPAQTQPEQTRPTQEQQDGDRCQGQHTDQDDNGKCDDCGTTVVVIIDFYNINDLHGKIADGENHPGVDELTTYLKKVKKTNDHTVLLSTGDMWQGSSESNLTKGLLTTEWMNHAGFAAMSLGNHEYDWGEDPIKENEHLAQFPLLAINVYDRSTNKRVSYCDSSVMVKKGGIQIGIIGAMGDCYSSISADKVKDVYFKVGNDLTNLVKNEATKLRQQGADYIVYLLHDGYTQSKSNSTVSVTGRDLRYYYDVALSDGYVDLVFEGHTHQRYILKDEYGTYHLQNSGENKGISHVEISINTANGNDKVRMAELISTGKYATMADDPIVEELLDKYDKDVSTGSDVLGKNAKVRKSYELQQLCADLYYKKGMELWGDEYDIVLGGGFISVRSPYELASGDITYGMLYSLFPFDNDLVLCSIKGRDLRDKFFETDNDRYYISYGDYGADVKRNLDPDATYYVIVDSYTSVYGPNRLTEIKRYEKQYYARDMLADYAKSGGFKK